MTTLRMILFFAIASSAATFTHAEEWMKMQQVNQKRAQAKGDVQYREEERAGKKFVVITVNVWTKAIGRLTTAHGHAVYTIFKPDGSVYKVMNAGKYASTDAFKTENEQHSSVEMRFLADSFFANLDTDVLVVYPEEKSAAPSNLGEALVWVKDVLGPELDKIRLQVMKEAAGTIKEGPGWVIKKRGGKK